MTHSDPLAAAMLEHRDRLLTVADLAALRAGRLMFETPRRTAPDSVTVAGYADPTAATVADGRRLRLRAAYLATVATIERSNLALRDVEAELRAALVPYAEDFDNLPERPADRPGILPYAV